MSTAIAAASWPSRSTEVGISLSLSYLSELQNRRKRLFASDLLGGASVLGEYIPDASFDPLLWDGLIREGLPIGVIDAMLKVFHASQKEFLEFLDINERAIQRKRLGQPAARLDADAALRIVGVARVVARAIDTLGSPPAADRWLSTANQSLGGEIPLQLASRPLGAQAVLDTLNSIDHGMFA